MVFLPKHPGRSRSLARLDRRIKKVNVGASFARRTAALRAAPVPDNAGVRRAEAAPTLTIVFSLRPLRADRFEVAFLNAARQQEALL